MDEGLAAKFIPVGWAQLKLFRVFSLQGPRSPRCHGMRCCTVCDSDHNQFSGLCVN